MLITCLEEMITIEGQRIFICAKSHFLTLAMAMEMQLQLKAFEFLNFDGKPFLSTTI